MGHDNTLLTGTGNILHPDIFPSVVGDDKRLIALVGLIIQYN